MSSAQPPRNKRIRYPMVLPVYDTYCDIMLHSPADFDKQMCARVGRTGISTVYEVQDELARTLRTCRVYAVDDGAVAELHRAFEKERRKMTIYTDAPPAIPFPQPPHSPMWLEFLGDGIRVGDERLGVHHVHALLVRTTPKGIHRFMLIGADPREHIDRMVGSDSPLAALAMLPTQILDILPDGTWAFEQGACSSQHCPIAPGMVQLHYGGLPAVVQTEHAGLAAQGAGDVGAHCVCYGRATTWFLLLRLLLWLITAEGIGATVEERRATVRDDIPLKKDLAQATRAEADAWNTTHSVRYTRISLSSRTIVRYIMGADGKRQKVVEHLSEEESALRLIGRHKRFLYPGPGKPWKAAQILTIEPFVRRVRTAAPVPTTRYLVTE